MNIRTFTQSRTLLALLAIATAPEMFAQPYTWSSAGPILTAGRARNMIVDRNNSSVLYVGSSTSGIFKSVDAGSNWSPVNDQDAVRNISYMAQATDGTIYAGTGEGFLRYGQKAKAQPGTGLYKLVQNNLVQVVDSGIVGNVINRVACHPTNKDIIALATNRGIMITQDGSTFMLANITGSPNPQQTNYSYGMDVKFDANGILYCSLGNERGLPPLEIGVNYSLVHSKVFKSTDASLSNFANITPTSAVTGTPNYGRIELAIAPSNPNIVYASCANKNLSTTLTANPASASLKALFVSTDAGSTWKLIMQGASQLDPMTNGGTIASGDYAHVLWVNPSDPHMLFIGGYKLYLYMANSSNPASGTMVQVGSPFTLNFPYYLHENVHDIQAVFDTNLKFYVITDAGIYRSTDILTAQTNSTLPSFQAFYKGLVTGQFNSVSIQRFPSVKAQPDFEENPGDALDPYYGYIGGTGGNGMTYFSGSNSQVTQETNFLFGEVYNAEFSKILPDAAIFTSGSGGLYRVPNVKNADEGLIQVNVYKDPISEISATPIGFTNQNMTTGTPFRLWENYGQVSVPPDSTMFYNDSVRVISSIQGGVQPLTTTQSFTFPAIKRNDKFSRIDSIVIRTGTLEIAADPSKIPTAFQTADKRDIRIRLTDLAVTPSTMNVTLPGGATTVQTVYVYQGADLKVSGPIDTVINKPKVIMNHNTMFDDIIVTFTSPPFAIKTNTYSNIKDPALYYKVFATIFYKYKAGDTVTVEEDNISTKGKAYTVVLPNDLNWRYGNGKQPMNDTIPPSNKPVMIPVGEAARLAVAVNNLATGNQWAIAVSKAPLSLNAPLNFIRVAQSGAYTDSANGSPSFNRLFYSGRPVLLEWSKSGTELYFATTGPDNRLYRVSHITRLMDLSAASRGGKFNTDVYAYSNAINSSTPNRNSPYRTTLIGNFGNKTISSINVSNDGTRVMVTLNPPANGTSTLGSVYVSTSPDIRKANDSEVWAQKDNNDPKLSKRIYCAMQEMRDDKKVFLGTDEGIVYTNDITQATPVWYSSGQDAVPLPRVQVFDIEQQTLMPDASFNSGEILVATNGRGIWSNRVHFVPWVVGVEEHSPVRAIVGKNLVMYPNPTSGNVSIQFSAMDGEEATIQVYDLSGRMVQSEHVGKLDGGVYVHEFRTDQLGSGVYIVNVAASSGIQRVTKLVVNK